MVLTLLLLATLLSPALQTATPPAGATLAGTPPATILAALDAAAPPETLTGNTDAEIVLASWEEHYGEPLATAEGAWVLTGSNQFPMASILVFASPDSAADGLGDFRRDSAATRAGALEAWLIADRGKWICVAVDGPVLLLGQGEPVRTDEPEADVQDRACAVVVETHAWLLDLVGAAPATPAATATGSTGLPYG